MIVAAIVIVVDFEILSDVASNSPLWAAFIIGPIVNFAILCVSVACIPVVKRFTGADPTLHIFASLLAFFAICFDVLFVLTRM